MDQRALPYPLRAGPYQFIIMMRPCLAAALVLLAPLCAQRMQAIGPFGGSAAIVRTDPRRPHTLLAGAANALLFQSTDSGDSWAALPFPPALRATLHALLICPITGDYWAALSSENNRYSGLFRSADGGRTWSRLENLGSREVWSIAQFGLDSRVIAAGTSDGVFLTRDRGARWQRISPQSNLELRPVVSLGFDLLDSRILYAGTPHLPWITTDGGANWNPSGPGMEDDSDVFSILVEAPLRHVLASACSGIYRSLNGGADWKRLSGAASASYRTYQVIQHPAQYNLLFAATALGLIKSSDAGATWRRLSTDSTHFIAFDTQIPSRIYIATDDAGLLRSDDLGERLLPINNGFCNRRLLSIAAFGQTLYAGSAAGILRRVTAEAGWENLLTPRNGAVLKIATPDKNHVLALTSRSVLFSRDGGTTWLNRTPPVAPAALTDLLASGPGYGRTVVSAGVGIWYSDDAGHAWRAAHLPKLDGPIRSLVPIGKYSAAAITRSMLLLSADGVTYQAVPSPETGGELYALVASGSGTLIAATSHGLKRSEDAGATWQSVKGAVNRDTVTAVLRHPARPGVLFAARYGDLFETTDDGRSWARLTTEPLMPPVTQLVISPGDPDHLFALTHDLGVYVIALEPALTTERASREFPESPVYRPHLTSDLRPDRMNSPIPGSDFEALVGQRP